MIGVGVSVGSLRKVIARLPGDEVVKEHVVEDEVMIHGILGTIHGGSRREMSTTDVPRMRMLEAKGGSRSCRESVGTEHKLMF